MRPLSHAAVIRVGEQWWCSGGNKINRLISKILLGERRTGIQITEHVEK